MHVLYGVCFRFLFYACLGLVGTLSSCMILQYISLVICFLAVYMFCCSLYVLLVYFFYEVIRSYRGYRRLKVTEEEEDALLVGAAGTHLVSQPS